jgi:hypothetical protein
MQYKKNTSIKILTVVSLTVLLAVLACSSVLAAEKKSATEIYVGGGRACTGKLIVNAKTISWMTSFSQCASQPYSIVNLPSVDANNRVFQLSRPSSKCLYNFINIKILPETGQIQVTGFKKIEDYEKKNFDEALICPVVLQ